MTSDDYLSVLQALLPPGKIIWSRDPESDITKLLHALADELARIDNKADDLINEAHPSTAFEMLHDWERATGLPDICTEDYTDLEKRTANVENRVAEIGDQSIPFFQTIAARLGYEITIQEHRPFRVGMNSAGDMICPDEWIFVWKVDAPASAEDTDIMTIEANPFTAGDGEAGTGLFPSYIFEVFYGDTPAIIPTGWTVHTYRGNKLLECLIRQFAPAHTHVNFSYGG